MISPGLVSVTFRQLSAEEVVELACQAGLAGIEWGGDIHVPHGDLMEARRVGDLTRFAGLRVVSYGSYYRVWPMEPAPFETVLETALALGAPNIRVWAGKSGSLQITAQDRASLVEEARRIARLAAQAGVSVAFELHANTLTDSDESTLDLLQQANNPNLHCYWQPRVSESLQANTTSLERIAPWLLHLHVFHWARDASGRPVRRALAEGATFWQNYIKRIRQQRRERFALLEFVRDDSPQAFLEDAAVLKDLCADVPMR